MKLGDVKQGTKATIAGREWDVLDKKYGGVLCLTHDIVYEKEFDGKNRNNWKDSTLRKFLHSDFYRSIKEKGAEPMMHESDLTTDDGLTDYGKTYDEVFLLTADQYRKYRKYISPVNDCWWLSTANSTTNHFVHVVGTDESIHRYKAYLGDSGVRPACVFPQSTDVEKK